MMRRSIVVLGLLLVARAGLACPPPPAVLAAAKTASVVELVHLGERAESSPLDEGPDGFLGLKRIEAFNHRDEVAHALAQMIASRGNYDCSTAAPVSLDRAAPPIWIGLVLHTASGPMRAAVHLSDGQVRLEFVNGLRLDARLGAAGGRDWRHAVTAICSATGRKPAEFYAAMGPEPPKPAPEPSKPTPVAKDTTHASSSSN